MTRTWLRRGLVVVFVIGGFIRVGGAAAHECDDVNGDGDLTEEECFPTKVWGGWRPNFVPLFDYPGRDDAVDANGQPADQDERRTYQRWRDEYGCEDTMCIWGRPNMSVAPDEKPRSLHAGIAADHSFSEGFHDAEGHTHVENNHDSHGGTIYADLCISEDSHYTAEMREVGCTGPDDTEIGVLVVDHLDCTFGCADEYHIIRPLDSAFTQAQVDELAKDLQWIAAHPDDWLCGYDGYGSSCPLPDSEG